MEKRRILAIIMALVMIIGVSPANAFAESADFIIPEPFGYEDNIDYLTIIAPSNANVQLFRQQNYHQISTIERTSYKDLEDGRSEFGFPSGGAHFRVSMPDMITRTGFTTQGRVYVEFEDNENPQTQEHIHTMMDRMEASTMVNVNTKNHLTMNTGGTFRLRGFRAPWEIIDGVLTNQIVQPDFHVNVLYGAEHINITSVANQSSWFDISAISAGTAIIEVHYDAIRNGNNLYGATHPHRKSVVVITIGGGTSDVNFAHPRNTGTGNAGLWDTEFDTVYYLNTQDYGVFPVNDSGIQSLDVAHVSNGILGSWKPVSADGETFNVPVSSGNNIVRAMTSTGVDYQVVRAAQITPIITNLTSPGLPISPGDRLTLRFDGLFTPAPKIANIYNPTLPIMGSSAGNSIEFTLAEARVSAGSQYTFPNSHAMAFTAPDVDGSFMFTDGNMPTAIFGFAGGFGPHRNLTNNGTNNGGNAPTFTRNASILPDVPITVGIPEDDGEIEISITIPPREDAYYVDGWFVVHSPDGELHEAINHILARYHGQPEEGPFNYSIVQRLRVTGVMAQTDFFAGTAGLHNPSNGLLRSSTNESVAARIPPTLNRLIELDFSGLTELTGTAGGNFPTTALFGLSSLERLRMPANIGVNANTIRGASNLKAIVFGDGEFTEDTFDFRGIEFTDAFPTWSFTTVPWPNSPNTSPFPGGPRTIILPSDRLIAGEMFRQMERLEEVIFVGDGLANINANAFASNANLHTVHFYSDVAPPTIAATAFSNINPLPVAIVPDRDEGGYELAGFRGRFYEVISRNTASANHAETAALALSAHTFTPVVQPWVTNATTSRTAAIDAVRTQVNSLLEAMDVSVNIPAPALSAFPNPVAAGVAPTNRVFTVNITGNDGSEASVTITVNIEFLQAAASGVNLTTAPLTGRTTVIADSTLQFNAAVVPAGIPQSVVWNVSGHPNVSINAGLLSVGADVPANTELTVTATTAIAMNADGEPVIGTAVITVVEPITVFTSLEGFTIGHGFYIKPTAVTVPAGSNAMVATAALLEANNLTHTGGANLLSRVNNLFPGNANPPQFMIDAIDANVMGMFWTPVANANGSLGMGDFGMMGMSGWAITINHDMIDVGAGAYIVTDGDVIRWQFTVLGNDLGLPMTGFAPPFYTHADKTELIRALFTDVANPSAIPAALDVIINPLATAEEVAAALVALNLTSLGDITVYISFEGFNLGHGFYIEPMQLTLAGNSLVREAVEVALDADPRNLTYSGGAFFIDRIFNIHPNPGEIPNVPDYIIEALNAVGMSLESGRTDGSLGSYDYSPFAGWMYTVNHVLCDDGVGTRRLSDGDVIRFQFSVYGIGEDLGVETWGGPSRLYTHADKTELIRTLFLPNINESAVPDALAVIIDPLTTDAQVAAAIEALLYGTSQVTPDERLDAAVVRANAALASFNATNTTTADDVLALVQNAAGLDISATWQGIPITTPAQVGQAGSIVGEIILTLDGLARNVTVNLTLPVLPQPIPAWEVAMNNALDRIQTITTNPTIEVVGGEWAVLALARGGRINAEHAFAQIYLENLKGGMEELIERGHWTDLQRVTLALTSLGIDATDFNGQDLTALYSTFIPASGRPTHSQTINADVYALLALDSNSYDGDRLLFVESILNAQNVSGNFGLLPGFMSIDITAMVIQALAPYYFDDHLGVRDAVNRALTWLSTQNIPDAEGNAQMIVALTSIGRGTQASEYVEALLTFYDSATGGFRRGANVNALTTEQAAYALVAYWRYVNELNRLYDMSDALEKIGGGTTPPTQPQQPEQPTQPERPTQPQQARAFISVIDPNYFGVGRARTFLSGRWININQGETVYSLLRRTDLDISSRGNPNLGGMYVESINGWGEFDDGPLSGWMYSVNSVFPDVSSSLVTLRDGDRVAWLFTRDNGNDLGGNAGNVAGGSTAPRPEEEERKIEEARTPIAEAVEWENIFNDVKESDWFFDAVRFVNANGIMVGTGEDIFSPNSNITRAMVVTILWRHEGEPTAISENTFDDVLPDRWYSDAIAWAVENGIVLGFGDGQFAPNDYITREQFAVILMRYANWLELSVTGTGNLSAFADRGQISVWAQDAMRWAVANGLISGRTSTMLQPKGNTTRAEAATILQRFLSPDAVTTPVVDTTEAGWETAMNSSIDWLYSEIAQGPHVGSVGGEWAILALARAGRISASDAWVSGWFTDLNRLLGEVDRLIADGNNIQNPASAGIFPSSLRRWTDFQRITLALGSLGIDASDYNGRDLTEFYRAFVPISQRHALNQTVNVDTFALIALDSGQFSGDRNQFINSLLDSQRADGVWSLGAGSNSAPGMGDIDITAMVIQALAPYYGSNSDVRVAVDRSLNWLRSQTFSDPEGTAQMIVALTALGSEFADEALYYVNHLLQWFDSDSGAFRRPNIDSPINMMATEQAAYALVAYWRFVNNMNSLYDMSDVLK